MRLHYLFFVLLFPAYQCNGDTEPDALPVGQLIHAVVLKRHVCSSPVLPNGRILPFDFDYSYELLADSRFSAINRTILKKIWPEGTLAKSMRSWSNSISPEDIPDYEGGGYHDVIERIGYIGDQGVSFSLEIDDYIGQAHPTHEIKAYWVDFKGDFHSVKEVIGRERLNQLEPIAEASLRHEEQMTNKETFHDRGLFDPSGQFAFSKEILIEGPRKLLLIYNDYEIGAYAGGAPHVPVVW